MLQLREVDPRTLIDNPNNARRTPVPQAMDDQMVASIKIVGILQPPVVRETPDGLMIQHGHRRKKNAIAAGKEKIDVIVTDGDAASDGMNSAIENLIRAPMTAVETWLALGHRLSKLGWTDQAIADALNLPLRRVRSMKLLANIHPPMLEWMAGGSMPPDHHLRIIASASKDEQAQVFKKYKPHKGEQPDWYSISQALSKRRMPATEAKFDDTLAKAYGVEWEEDMFAPADEDGRYTTNVEGFLGAQQEWMQNHLPKRGTILTVDNVGAPQLPKKAERVFDTPRKTDIIGHYVNPRNGAVETMTYRVPQPTKPGAVEAGAGAASDEGGNDNQQTTAAGRPDITQKGIAMIGDFRTAALHKALAYTPADNDTLLGLLILALGCRNVSVVSGTGQGCYERRTICDTITEGGTLTADRDALRKAARLMLISVLSCRENASQSGPYARIAGEAIGASTLIQNMATEEFLSCLSRTAIETVAAEAGATIGTRVRDTRAHLIAHHAGGTYVHSAALFKFNETEAAQLEEERKLNREYAADDSDFEDEADADRTDAHDLAA